MTTTPGHLPAEAPPAGSPSGPPTEPPDHATRFATQERILTLVWGYMSSDLVDLATRLRLPDLVGDGTRSADELAADTGSDPLAMLRFLRALAALGLAEESAPGAFRLSPTGERLRSDVPDSLFAFTRQGTGVFRQAWSHLEHSLKTGEPAFDQVFGTDFFQYLATRPELSDTFTSSMREGTRTLSTALATEYDFSSFGTVMDVGGADGSLLATVLGAHPDVRGVVFDSVEGAQHAAGNLAEAGLADRGSVHTGDFFTRVPDGGDLYVLKSILHDWDDAHALRILHNCRAAVPDSGRLLLVEVLLPGQVDASAHPLAYLSDLYMLVNMGGRERTAEDFSELLAATGFRTTRVTSPQALTPFSLVEAEPVAGPHDFDGPDSRGDPRTRTPDGA